MSPLLQITVRRPLRKNETIFLVGPGGVGKSTLGKNLACLTGYQLIDLDLEFCRRLAIIGPFIAQHGYEAYRSANLTLARQLVDTIKQPTVVVTSSGFLAAPPQSEDYRDAKTLIETGYSMGLLPSLNIEVATSIVVGRQLDRGFCLERESETVKFRARFAIYRDLGDMRIVSAASPDAIAARVFEALERR